MKIFYTMNKEIKIQIMNEKKDKPLLTEFGLNTLITSLFIISLSLTVHFFVICVNEYEEFKKDKDNKYIIYLSLSIIFGVLAISTLSYLLYKVYKFLSWKYRD